MLLLVKRIIQIVAVILLINSVLACGYRLLGSESSDRPFPAIAVVNQPSRVLEPLAEKVTQRLISQGIVAGEDDYIKPILQLSDEEIGQAIAAVDLAGDVIEYRRYHRIKMTVFAANGQLLMPAQMLMAERRYRFDETRLLASQAEARRIAQSLSDELLDRVIMRLYALKRDGDTSTASSVAGSTASSTASE